MISDPPALNPDHSQEFINISSTTDKRHVMQAVISLLFVGPKSDVNSETVACGICSLFIAFLRVKLSCCI